MALIRVTITSAEYWDASYLLNLLKAVVTGTRVDTTGEHGKLS